MIDVGPLRARIAEMPNASDATVITRLCLEQLLDEIEAGQAAQASLARIDAHIGETFSGLKL